jgi:phosphatidylglycerophosphatase A
MNNRQTGRKSFFYWIRKLGASVFFLGYFPYGPGTVGSAVTVGALWYLDYRYKNLFTPEHLVFYWGAIMILALVSIYLSSQSKEVFGSDDPKPVIIDEVVGQFVTFFMIPLSIRTLIVGFFLFRLFDIIKPFPVHRMEEMEGGVGITMDDIAAGVMANISLMLILAGYHWVKSYL